MNRLAEIRARVDYLAAELAAAQRRAEAAEADADRLSEAFYSTGSGPNDALAAHREAVAGRRQR